MIVPASCCVRELNALQNSMMLTPCWPRAGPTGGAGLAAPAGIWSLIRVSTFLAIARRTRIQGWFWAAAALALTLGTPASADAAFAGANGRIYFTAFAPSATNPDVWSVNPDGSGLANLTDLPGGPGEGADPSVSSNGVVAFVVGGSAAGEIWTMGPDGSGPRRLTDDGFADRMPAISPDGTRIAFASDRGVPTATDLWTIAADGSDP